MCKLFVKEAHQTLSIMKRWREEKIACGCLTSQRWPRALFVYAAQLPTPVGCCWWEKRGLCTQKYLNKPTHIKLSFFFLVEMCPAHVDSSLLYGGSPYCLLHVNGLLTMYGVMRPWVQGQLWYMMVKIGLCCTDDLISIFWGLGDGKWHCSHLRALN